MYSKKIINEFLEPRNYGVIRGASGVGKVVSDVGNEIVKIYLSVEGKKIVDAQFQTFGGVVAIALTSFATAELIGKTLDDAAKFPSADLLKLSGPIPEEKNYLVGVVVNAVRKAAASVGSKNVKDED